MQAAERPPAQACVIGYGNAGRLHARLLAATGTHLSILDPHHQHLPAEHRSFSCDVADMPAELARQVDLWTVCCPTADHLPVLTAVLAHNPAARILLEKPACQGHEIDAFTALLERHPAARLIVNDQYRYSTTLPAFTDLMDRWEPGAQPDRIQVTFTKDRTGDISTGRFIDRHYGVLGYEWLHMLTVLGGVLPADLMDAYLGSDITAADLWATYDPRLLVAALTEHTTLDRPGGRPLHLELASSIVGPSVLLGSAPPPGIPWQRNLRPADTRQRHLTVHAGETRFGLHLEPVSTPDGWQLQRNHHRLTAVRRGEVLYDEVLRDSPMENSVRHAMRVLLADTPLPAPHLGPLRRIAELAGVLRSRSGAREVPPVAV